MVLNIKPILQQNYSVELALSGDFQKSTVDNNKDMLLRFLVEKLSNNKINFIYKVTEAARSKRVYTNEDKYKFLLAKNSNLEELRKKFNLDFD